MELVSRISRRVRVAFSITSLGDSVMERVKLLYAGIWLPLRVRLGLRGHPIPVKLTKFGKSWPVYIHDESDLSIFKEIFVDEEYSIDLKKDPETLIDLGSHVGYSIILFKMKYPEIKVYAFEPDPGNFEKMKSNVSGLESVSIYNKAVSSKGGKVKLKINRRSESSSLVDRYDTKYTKKVRAETLDGVIDSLELGEIDILKFDIEGAEGEVFRESEHIDKVKHFVGEFHPNLCNIGIDEFVKLFPKFNTNIVGKKDGKWIVSGKSKI